MYYVNSILLSSTGRGFRKLFVIINYYSIATYKLFTLRVRNGSVANVREACCLITQKIKPLLHFETDRGGEALY